MRPRPAVLGRGHRIARAAAVALTLVISSSCAGSSGTDVGGERAAMTAAARSGSVADLDRCLVRLHGKGASGTPTTTVDGVVVIAPDGNADAWGGRQWRYFPDEEYAAARKVVAEAVRGCRQIIIDGFSNGASFAAKLYCRGESFDGRLVHVVVDDPVVDAGVTPCSPVPSVALTLYWTGALDAQAQPGWRCADVDWTCEGGTTVGIESYAHALGAEPRPSPFHDHRWYVGPPELSAWRSD